MKTTSPKTTYLVDYRPSPYRIIKTDLIFELDDEKTIVTANHSFIRAVGEAAPLILNGEELELLSIHLNGRLLDEKEYLLDDKTLTLLEPPQEFQLLIKTRINPVKNTALDGLYKSGDILCTQNEPEGFRRITYFLDRPDIMAKYTTKIVADKSKYPILLSNGNPIDSGEGPEGKHWIVWEDPFPKPCYLFALVAGDLGCVKDTFTTRSNRIIDLRIYCDKGNESKCLHAMRSLKKSMQWDEEVFGLEYDLDIFMIVAVDAFNFGAMENKGLNIFNTSCVLADEETATDDNFSLVEGVIAHEYFHNWTGNRVTCRDWFQLTLKEGLTVFRDQEFSSDCNSRPLKRIQDVIALRSAQFAEDAGPTSHPIKPKSYIEINNFYTSTIYNKGAEVIRMIRTFIGKEAFRRGIDKYFELYDGQAVTTEDFIHAMELASGMDLTEFSGWYHQSGTPVLEVKCIPDPYTNQLVLEMRQINKATADQKEKQPLCFPLEVGFIGPDGKEVAMKCDQEMLIDGRKILKISKETERFVFKNASQGVVPSLNRQYSAPIKIEAPYTKEERLFLMAYDSDDFNRWDASQELATDLILDQVKQLAEKNAIEVDKGFIDAFGKVLEDPHLDMALKAKILTLPSEELLGQRQGIIDFDGIYRVREHFSKEIAEAYYAQFLVHYYGLNTSNAYHFTPEEVGKRSLKNTCLAYLMKTKSDSAIALCAMQFDQATNMTDSIIALALLCQVECPEKDQALAQFYKRWKNDPLVMCKWLSVQAASKLPNVLERVEHLSNDPIFDKKIPNLVRALYGTFIDNTIYFHSLDGKGYAHIADQVLLMDKINPHVAARIAGGFKKYARVDGARQKLMKVQLDRILAEKDISPHIYEILSKCAG